MTELRPITAVVTITLEELKTQETWQLRGAIEERIDEARAKMFGELNKMQNAGLLKVFNP